MHDKTLFIYVYTHICLQSVACYEYTAEQSDVMVFLYGLNKLRLVDK